MKLIWSKRALGDLEQIGSFIAISNPERARVYLQILIDRTKSLVQFPESGRVVPEFQNSKIRELIEGNYRIVYKVDSIKTITVLTIFEGHRLIRNIKK